MHGAIRKYDVTDADHLSNRVREELVPLVRDVPGFVAYYLLDVGGGAIISVTICEDEAAGDQIAAVAASWMKDKVASLGISGQTVGDGPITVNQFSAATVPADDYALASATPGEGYREGDWG